MRKISIAIPNYNRYELLLQSFHCVLGDERVSEIIIQDDHSNYNIYEKVFDAVRDEPKIKLYRNISNQDCYVNKRIVLSHATNDWVILFDSDNIIDSDYIDRLYEFNEWHEDIIYQPCYAKPTFNFKAFAGLTIDRENVHSFVGRKMFDTMLNAMNYFVNRDEYLKVWDGSANPHTADSIYQAYNWFKAGNKMLVVDGMEYIHRIHDGSHYKNNNHKTGNFYDEVVNNLKNLK